MERLKETEQFKVYKEDRGAQDWLDERSDIVKFLKGFVIWVEKIYGNIANRVNHNLGLSGSVTWDPGSIANGAEEAKEVTVTNAALGDFAIASFSLDVTDLILDAQVTAANTVTCVLANNTGGALDLAEGTLRVKVIKK